MVNPSLFNFFSKKSKNYQKKHPETDFGEPKKLILHYCIKLINKIAFIHTFVYGVSHPGRIHHFQTWRYL